MESERKGAAQEAMLPGLLEVEKREGFRGPVLQFASRDEQRAFLDKSTKAIGDTKIEEGRYYVGLVTAIEPDGQMAELAVGPHRGKLPLLGMRWARKVNPVAYYPSALISSVKSAVHVGDAAVVKAG